MSGILLISGEEESSILSASLVSAAQRIASEQDWVVTAICRSDEDANRLRHWVDRVVVVDPDPPGYEAHIEPQLVKGVWDRIDPDVVVLPHDHRGIDLGPRLAVSLGIPFLGNCVGWYRQATDLVFTRAVFKGRLRADVGVEPIKAVVALHTGRTTEPIARETPAPVEEVLVECSPEPAIQLLEEIAVEEDGIDITKSDVVVAGGRGIGDRENFRAIEDLAVALGGVAACSRPLVDIGWQPSSRQVGISGKTVDPRLYVACGISGATEHVAGMKDSEVIVVINNDPTASMFKHGTYGIVGDLNDVIPAIIKAVTDSRQSRRTEI